MLIAIDCVNVSAVRAKYLKRCQIRRRFNKHGVTGVQQNFAQQVQSLLRASGQNHIGSGY
ncbi:hypothetical protein D3C75_1151940 [compost metagenome]